MSRALAATVTTCAAAALAVVLTGCGGGSPDRTGAPAAGSAPSSDPAPGVGADVGPCPDLPAAEPRANGLPDLELPCLGEGPSVNLAHLRGEPTVVNVWAAWCVNCDREMPLFADAVTRYGDEVRFFGIHYKAPRDYGLRSEVDFGVPFPSAHDENGDRVARALRATAPPQTLFVDAQGRVVGRKIGEIKSADEFDQLVEDYLGVRL